METEVATVETVEGIAPVAVGEFTGKPGNLHNDLAALAAELSPKVPSAQAEVVPETQPDQPAMASATVVPEKFKGPDGSLDVSKVEKSTVNAEATLAKYVELEKVLRQKQNEVNRLSQQHILPNVAPVVPTANQVPLTAFEIQVANDLINEAAAYGYQMPQGQAIAQARVQVKMAEARHQAEASLTESLRIKLEDQDRRTELNALAENDASVLTPEGFDALSKIRESKPWINQSQTPWTEAYNYYLADQVKKARHAGTVLPTPTGLTAKAPPTPVSPALRVSVQPTGPDLNNMSESEITAYVTKMTPDQEAKFWKSRGLSFK